MSDINYEVGDIIEYTAFGGVTRRVKVEAKEADIKNGRPGFDGYEVHGFTHEGCWGYDSQVTRVVERSSVSTEYLG